MVEGVGSDMECSVVSVWLGVVTVSCVIVLGLIWVEFLKDGDE